MKRILILLFLSALLCGCAKQQEKLYTHVVEDDYISDTYYMTEIEPRERGDVTPTDYGVFEKVEPGVYRLLLNIGAYTDIYPARNQTLVRKHILYFVDDHDIVSYNLRASDPLASEKRIEGFFPEELDVLTINALNDTFVFVYAELNRPISQRIYPTDSTSDFKPYLSYFAIRVDGGGFMEVAMDEVPVQKRQ